MELTPVTSPREEAVELPALTNGNGVAEDHQEAVIA